MRTRKLLLILPADEYARLERAAEREERDAVQQVRYLVRRALAVPDDERPVPAGAGHAR